jgi:UDP-hydrolysing UDP-N-acetyl-D-glucosamine 2-epimerase
MKRKIMVVVTARASYSRFKTALKAMRDHPDIELYLEVTASALLDRYGATDKFISKDGFDINNCIYTVLEGENHTSMAKTTGIGIIELSTIMDNTKPDMVVTIADRYETMATAISAAYMGIPLVHIQGGEVTGNIDEKVRHSITKLADIHLVSNEDAAERVKKLGENKETIFITGCPSIDIAAEIANQGTENFNIYDKYAGSGNSLDLSDGYIIAMQHPVTTETKDSGDQVLETLHAVHDIGLPILWFWPNVDAGSDWTSKAIRTFREEVEPNNIQFFKNIDGADFLKLLNNSICIIGNSSVAIREASYLGVPAVNIGTRQNGRLRGNNVIDVDYDRKDIIQAIRKIIEGNQVSSSRIYGNGNAGKKVAEILATVNLTIDKKITY